MVDGTTNTKVTWSATGGTVSSDGVYTAPTTVGTYTLKATSAADTSVVGTATITVASGINVTVSPSSTTITPGSTKQFYASVVGTTNTDVTWTATGGTISSSGLFTAPSTTGTYTITATSAADSSRSGTAAVIVANDSSILVTLTPATTSCGVGESTQFTATVSNATDSSVTWSATGGTITSAGLYTAPSTAGTYTITATSVENTAKTATATVQVNPITITLTPTSGEVAPGGTYQFSAVVTGASDRTVTWSTSAGSISSSGLLTAPTAAGDVTVTATSNASSSVKASGTVTVVVPTSYSFNFNDGIPTSYFSPNSYTATAPNSQIYWGKFHSNETGTMSLPGLAPHQHVVIAFDVYVVDNWKGVDSDHLFNFKVDGTTILNTSFSNSSSLQSYPDTYGGSTHAAGTSSSAQNTLGYSVTSGLTYSDTTYHISYTLSHTSSTLNCTWTSSLDNTTPFWGIDNVTVTLTD